MTSYSPEDLVLTAEDLAGVSVSLPIPIEFEIVKSYDSPASSFEGIFSFDREYGELYRLTVMCGAKRLFMGLIDEHAFMENDEGRRMKISARSKGAILLDNEAKPQIYENISFTTIFNNHVRPYGFTSMVNEQNPRLSQYAISKGMSEWEVLYNFYRSSKMGMVMIDEDDVIRCNLYPPSEQTFYISNVDPAAVQFTSFKAVNNRYAPVSRFLVRDKAGAYSYTYNNRQTAEFKFNRTRYLNPAIQFTVSDNGGISEAEIRVRQSMLSKQVITVTCPGFAAVKVSDRAELHTTLINYYGRFVHQVRYRLSPSGAETTLTLLNYSYI